MELANVVKGEAELSLKIEENKVKVIVSYDGKQTDAKIEVAADIEQFAEMLKEAVPGDIDDKIIDGLLVAMKMVA